MLRLLGMVSIMIRKTAKPVDYARQWILEFEVANMAMMRNLGTLVPVTAHVEERIRGRVVSNVFESGVFVLHYVTFGTPWDQVGGASSLDLSWGQRLPGISNRGGVDGCTTSEHEDEDAESCPAPHGDGV